MRNARVRQAIWFAGLWIGGVVALAALTGVLRLIMQGFYGP